MSHTRELHVKLMHVQLLKNTSRDFMVVFVHVFKLKSLFVIGFQIPDT